MSEVNRDRLNKLVIVAEKALEMCVKEADEHGLSFEFNIGNASNVDRSIGGQYYGKGTVFECEDDAWDVQPREYNENTLEFEVDDEDNEIPITLEEGRWSAWTSSSEHC